MNSWLEDVSGMREIKLGRSVNDPHMGWIEIFPKGFWKTFVTKGDKRFSVRMFNARGQETKKLLETVLFNLDELVARAKLSVEVPDDYRGHLAFSQKILMLKTIIIDSSVPTKVFLHLESDFSDDYEFWPEVCFEMRNDDYEFKWATWTS